MSQPHITECDDGSTLFEWVLSRDAIFFISIEEDLAESGWGYVTKSGVMDDGPLLSEFFDAIDRARGDE